LRRSGSSGSSRSRRLQQSRAQGQAGCSQSGSSKSAVASGSRVILQRWQSSDDCWVPMLGLKADQPTTGTQLCKECVLT
jgi:hypothetical protein